MSGMTPEEFYRKHGELLGMRPPSEMMDAIAKVKQAILDELEIAALLDSMGIKHR